MLEMKKTALSLALVAIGMISSAHAEDANPVLLTVSGKISHTNSPDKKSLTFTYKDLATLGQKTIKATTTYTTDTEFKGTLVRDVLKKAGIDKDAKNITLVGLDGYQTRAPISDYQKWDAVVADTLNGKRLTLATKGPLWLMFPLDAHPEDLKNSVIANQLVWNLVAIKVE
jgi:hypothetical protein